MRPVGECTKAILAAASALQTPGHGGTLRELSAASGVGRAVAGYTIPKLAQRGHLEVVAVRVVTYRSRPVNEYVPAEPAPATAADSWRPLQDAWRALAR
jgi:hypothetical protein